MKRILIASLFSLVAAPVLATTPSFNDFPDQGQLDAGPTRSPSLRVTMCSQRR